MEVEIDDALAREVARFAEAAGVSVDEIVEEGLRLALDRRTRGGFRLASAHVDGHGLQSGIRPADWSQIRDLVYRGRGT